MLGVMQGHLPHFNQKSPLVKPSHKYKVIIPKGQEATMCSEINIMLLNETMDLGPGNKGFFTQALIISKNNSMSCFIMNLKPLNQFCTCTKFKMTTLK